VSVVAEGPGRAHHRTVSAAGPPKSRSGFSPGRILTGVALIGLGVVFLLDRAGNIDAGKILGDWWPVAIIAVGLVQLAERPRSIVGPAIVVGAGALLLLFTTDVLEGNVWNFVWPVVLIAIGLVIIARRGGGAVPAGAGEDVVRATGIFGGPQVASTSQRFRGASLTAICGGVTLDLRRARPAPEGATVSSTAVMGGIDILVPRGWKVTTSGTPIFGGIDDKVDRTGELPKDAPALHVDAVAIFGDVDVKHEE
jgi:predicted membrane protein